MTDWLYVDMDALTQMRQEAEALAKNVRADDASSVLGSVVPGIAGSQLAAACADGAPELNRALAAVADRLTEAGAALKRAAESYVATDTKMKENLQSILVPGN